MWSCSLFRILEERGTSREAVQAGVRIWEQNTCLKFQEKTGHFIGPHIQVWFFSSFCSLICVFSLFEGRGTFLD